MAVQFVINYEEGAEYNIVDGDARTEPGLAEAPGGRVPAGRRDMAFESMYEYGSRVGFWRLLGILADRQVPAAVFPSSSPGERPRRWGPGSQGKHS